MVATWTSTTSASFQKTKAMLPSQFLKKNGMALLLRPGLPGTFPDVNHTR